MIQPGIVHLETEELLSRKASNKFQLKFSSKKFYFQTMFYDNDKNFFIARKSAEDNTLSIANFSQDRIYRKDED